MKKAKIIIENYNPDYLVEKIKSAYRFNHSYSSKGIHVLVKEEFYFRIGSNLSTTIIIDFINENKCYIEVISAGGSEGWLGITWGSEGNDNKKITDFLKKLCDENNWKINIDVL